MSKKIFCSIAPEDAGKLYLFAETSEGYFGHNIGSKTVVSPLDEGYESTSNNSIRVVAVSSNTLQDDDKYYYCNNWTNLSDNCVVSNYGILTFTGTQSSFNQNIAHAELVGVTRRSLISIIDEHGTHYGTDSTTAFSTRAAYVQNGSVVGVKHHSTDSGYVFNGWSVSFPRGSASLTPQFISAFNESEAVTTDNTTIVSKEYDENYAIIIQVTSFGTTATPILIIRALYSVIYTVTFYINNTIYTTNSGTPESGISLPQNPPQPSEFEIFQGWNINGTVYSGNTFYPSGDVTSLRADAVFQDQSKYLTYVTSYGTPPSLVRVLSGTQVILDNPTASMITASAAVYYEFTGWLLTGSPEVRQPGYILTLQSDVTSTAQFAHIKVSVEYYNGFPSSPGQKIRVDEDLNYGTQYTLMNNIFRIGYIFSGWRVTDKSGVSIYQGGTQIVLNTDDQPIIAVAIWSIPQTFIISYNKNNPSVSGEAIPDESITEGNQVVIKDPTLWSLTGYYFSKWQINNSNQFCYPNDYITPSSNIILYAIWMATNPSISPADMWQSYTDSSYGGNNYYTYENRGYHLIFSTSVATQNIRLSYQRPMGDVGYFIHNGIHYTTYANGQYSGQTNATSGITSVTYDIPSDTSRPNGIQLSDSFWTNNTYQQYDSISSNMQYRYYQTGLSTCLYTAPTVPGYTFKGWYGLNTPIDNGASLSYIDKTLFTILISSSTSIQISTLIQCNYLKYIDTWNNTSSIIRYKEYYAPIRLIYEGNNINVILDPNGGYCSPLFRTYRVGDVYGDLPIPTPLNLENTFLGWFTLPEGGAQIQSSTIITTITDHSIYAHWDMSGGDETTYEVIFLDMTGTNLPATRRFTRGISSNLPLIQSDLGWTRPDGYTFATQHAWNTTSTYTGTFYADGASILDLTPYNSITLYAYFLRRTWQVRYDPNGGTVSPTSCSIPQGSPYGNMPKPYYSGYIFLGWFTSQEGGDEVNANMIPENNITLYAHWQEEGQTTVDWSYIRYKIILETNGGSLDSSYQCYYYYGEEKSLPDSSQITKSDYTFGGWFSDASFSGEEVLTISVGTKGKKTFYAKWL